MAVPKLIVIGSSNIDMVVKSDRMPRGGETLLGGRFVMVPGGKGANQAVCAAKLGANVQFISRVGSDVFGKTSLASLKKAGVGTDFIVSDPVEPTGVALIVVDASGENAIVVAPGANDALAPSDVQRAKDSIAEASAVVLQLEIPQETVSASVHLANSLSVPVILNPAPVRPLDKSLLESVDVLTPNQHEAAALLGRSSEISPSDAADAARELRAMGPASVVITLGSDGAYIDSDDYTGFIEAVKAKAVDTTAAGDSFTAALACGLAEGKNLHEAADFAAKVASIVVTRMGAQCSMPTRDEIL